MRDPGVLLHHNLIGCYLQILLGARPQRVDSTNDPRNISNIINYKGSHLFLGDGLYVSRDIEKTVRYGPVCFKLLVYPGKTLGV